MTVEQATDILLAAYMAEVESRHRTFVDDGQTRENCRRLASFLTNGNSRFGVMLCGICGNGKTTLLHAFRSAMGWMEEKRPFGEERMTIRVADAKEIVRLAKDVKSFDGLRSIPMLGIEDMGREPVDVLDFGNVLNPVVDLIEYRYDNQLFTFITTNLNGREIRRKYGDRIADRLNEMIEVIIFGDTTYRGMK